MPIASHNVRTIGRRGKARLSQPFAAEDARTFQEAFEADEQGRDALSELALKFTKTPRTVRLVINLNRGRAGRVHFEPSDK